MSRYPRGARCARGRFVIEVRLRGSDMHGVYRGRLRKLFRASREVIVSFRRWSGEDAYLDQLRYDAPGIAQAWIGRPDGRIPIDPREYPPPVDRAVIERRPSGLPLEDAGRLDLHDTVRFGLGLVDLVAAPLTTEKLRNGLRPETVFVDRIERGAVFSGATPRSFLFLGNGNLCPAFSGDPWRGDGWFDSSTPELVRTAAMLIWYAFLHEHPFHVGRRCDTANNIEEGVHRVFTGPPELGALLEAALVADPEERIAVDDLRDGLLRLAKSLDIEPPPFPPPGLEMP